LDGMGGSLQSGRRTPDVGAPMNSSVIRSPQLAEGGDVRVVRLYEVQEYARGGLARAAPVREVLMHLTAREADQLKKKWGSPGADGYGFKPGALRPVQRRADGGWLEGYGPNTKQPEPAKLARTQTPLAKQEDYYTYGERPEHQFFSENVTPKQPEFPSTPTGGAGGAPTGQSSSSSDALGALGLGLAAAQGWDAIKGGLGGGGTKTNEGVASDAKKGLTSSGSLSDGVGMNDLGGAIGGIQSLATKEGKFAGTASGASAGMSLGGWPGAIVGGVLGYAQEGGYKDANPWDASGFSGLGMDAAWEDQNIARLASNPAASLGSALGVSSDSFAGKLLDPGSFFSKHGDEKRNLKAFTEKFPLMDAGDGRIALPDGKIIDKKQLEKLAGAWYGATYHPDGDQEGWQQKFQQEVASLYGYAHGGALRAASKFATDIIDRHVRGPGSGRSDSIPAQLSDGEYVLTAEDVSLLGDGSNEAGAKRLDDFRTELRKHKGGALARGKISPDAKAPMEYLRGTR
jgi:hypothetical protein